MLQDERLIERNRAKRTFVRQRPRRQLWCEVATDWSGLLAPREEAVIEVLSEQRGFQPANIPHPIGTLGPSYRRGTTPAPPPPPAPPARRRPAPPARARPFFFSATALHRRSLEQARLEEGL